MAKLEFKNIEYMSQYVSYEYDEFVNLFNELIEKYSPDDQDKVVKTIDKLNDLMGDVNDNINEKFFNLIFGDVLPMHTLKYIELFYEYLSDQDFESLDGLLDNFISETMDDLEIYEIENLIEIINSDLRVKGIDSVYLDLIPAIRNINPNVEYVQINGYWNDIDNKYLSKNDALEDVFFQTDNELVDKFIELYLK